MAGSTCGAQLARRAAALVRTLQAEVAHVAKRRSARQVAQSVWPPLRPPCTTENAGNIAHVERRPPKSSTLDNGRLRSAYS